MAIAGSEPKMGTIVPCLVVPDIDAALHFYEAAFNATVLYRSPCIGGVGEHVHLQIWDSLVFLTREEPRVRSERVEYSMLASPGSLGGSTCIFQVRVTDADEVFDRAVRAGAAPNMPPMDMFWGDRYGLAQDPFGHVWAITAVNEILTPAQVTARLNIPVGKGKELNQ